MKNQIKVRAYSTTFLIDYPKNEELLFSKATEIVQKKVTYSAQVVSLITTESIKEKIFVREIPNPKFKDPENFEILNFDMSKYKKQ